MFLEQLAEMAVILISYPLRYFIHAHVGIPHQNFGLFKPRLYEIIDESHPHICLELFAQITGIVMILIGVFFERNLISVILRHIFQVPPEADTILTEASFPESSLSLL